MYTQLHKRRIAKVSKNSVKPVEYYYGTYNAL